MGGKGGDGNIYQSPYSQELDTLGVEGILSMLSGQPISPSPAMASFFVAQKLGGQYDQNTGNIKMRDGTTIRYNAKTNEFDDLTKGTDNVVTRLFGDKFSPDGQSATSKSWLDQANKINKEDVSQIFGEDSSYNLFGKEAFGSKVYDPETGQMIDKVAGQEPEQLTGQHYLDQYGDYLNQNYDPYQYEKYQPYETKDYSPTSYNQFDYKSPEIQGVDNISHDLVQKQINRELDQINSGYRGDRQNIENYIAESGGSLTGGRALSLVGNLDEQTNRARTEAQDKLETDHALRSFYDAQNVRDLQVAQDAKTQDSNAGESRYAQDTARLENKTAYDANRTEYGKAFDTGKAESDQQQKVAQDEGRFAYDAGQTQGKERLGIAASADSDQANRATAQTQADRQQQLQKIQALQDFLRIYAGQDATAGQLAAAQAQATGSALGGLFSGAGAGAAAFA